MIALRRESAFRLLRCRRRVLILQPDPEGVIRPLVDARTGAPFRASTKKLRRALAGRQRQVLCVAAHDGHSNAFFARVEEFVGIDPLAGEYVILSPLVRVLDTCPGLTLPCVGLPAEPTPVPAAA